jgi:hypothetical protein
MAAASGEPGGVALAPTRRREMAEPLGLLREAIEIE